VRKIIALTGIRSEYDLMFSVFKALHQHPRFDFQLIVAGAHLSEKYGKTVNEIRRDGLVVAEEIESLIDSDSLSGRFRSMAIQALNVPQVLSRLRPDILFAVGDREEAIVMALAGAYLNIPVAHFMGGDLVVGNVDDSVRHAVTKLSHIHFTRNEDSAERVRKM
jgi:GDP/UDP-N,N'-diacetylbacillosamine 2-epimerase (hydrolysing)